MKRILASAYFWFFAGTIVLLVSFSLLYPRVFSSKTTYTYQNSEPASAETPKPVIHVLDQTLYDAKLLALANNPVPPVPKTKVATVKNKDGTVTKVTEVIEPPPQKLIWPAKAPYPDYGAILPFKRIIAYYGNLYSTQMGILGALPEAQMLAKLKGEVDKWNAADPDTPAIPALQYIAVVAQGSPGDGKYRLRMPSSEIDKVVAMAQKINGIVFLDVQVGLSHVETEVPLLEKYLAMPEVHLAIDPEFSIKTNSRPGKVIGTMDAKDVNFVINYLSNLVKQNNLPPKILVVHRFTQNMVTNAKDIEPTPEVQVIMNMDGWGGSAKKIGTYQAFISPYPVQFTGFKLFYKEDTLTPGTQVMTPDELLKLNPKPIYIQYQ